MGNLSSKDSHGPAGAHLDVFHPPPTSTLSSTGVNKSPVSSLRLQEKPGLAGTGLVRQEGSAHNRQLSQGTVQEWTVIGSVGVISDGGRQADSGEVEPGRVVATVVQRPCPASTSASEASWLEKDSGLDQSLVDVGGATEKSGNKAIPSLEGLLEECRLVLGLSPEQEGAQCPADVVRHLLAEREKLAVEVQSLKDTMRAEQEEWLQFQSDLQVAVAVADRLRAEAEEELRVLRGAHREVEQQLATAQLAQEEVQRELEALRAQHQEAGCKLPSLGSERLGLLAQREARESAVQLGVARSRSQVTDRLRVPVKRSRGEEVSAEGRGVAETYLRSVAEGKRREEGLSGREPRRVVPVTERSRLPLPSESPSAVNGISQPFSVTAESLCKNQNTGPVRRLEQTVEKLDGRTATGKQEDAIASSDISSAISSKTRTQDGFSKLLRRHGGSKRNSLLRWCQNRTQGYKSIEITNFSSSWADGLALCAMYHTYLPSHIPYSNLSPENKRENLELAFCTGESVGIPATLNVEEMLKSGGPDWQSVLGYVESIYRHFEM